MISSAFADSNSHLTWTTLGQILCAGLFVSLLYKTVYELYASPLASFPGPKLWALSDLPQTYGKWYGDDALMKRALHARYGPVVRIGPTELIFDSAEAWKDIYGHRRGGKKSFIKDKKFYSKPINGADNIITADDIDHTRIRKTLSHAFSDRALKEQQDLLAGYAGKLVSKLSEAAASRTTVDLVKYWNCTTFDVMSDLTFGEPLNLLDAGEYNPWVAATFGSVKQGTRLRLLGVVPFLKWLVTRVAGQKMSSARLEHFNFSRDRVNKRLEINPERPDFWKLIMERQGDEKLSLPEMHSNASIFMIAGTETTATLLSGLTYHLLNNPLIMEKLVKEIRANRSPSSAFTVERLQSEMPYLNACINEGLRMYPPVPTGLPRTVPEGGAAICGFWVPQDTSVSVTQWAAYRSPTNFVMPDSFVPERWLGQDTRFKDDNRDAFQPFSTGPRNCIGRNLALHEARILLAEVIYKFNLELDGRSQDWAKQSVYTIWEKHKLWVDLHPATH